MSLLSRAMSALRGQGNQPLAAAKNDVPEPSLPTVRFDPTRVSSEIRADLRKNIQSIGELPTAHMDQIYEAALLSVSRGQDLAVLFDTIMGLDLPGITKRRAGEIARSLNNKATALMTRDSQVELGVRHAVWLYSGAPCQANPRKPSAADIRQDAAHKAADGKRYEVAKGMLINSRWTMPGVDDGCKCISRAVIPGFE